MARTSAATTSSSAGRGRTLCLVGHHHAQQMQQHSAVRASFREVCAPAGQDGVLLLPSAPDVAPLLTDSEQSLEDYRNQAVRMLCLAGCRAVRRSPAADAAR
jgi:hypothetical protein